MLRNREIFDYLCTLAPLNLQMDFDNSGFLLGHMDAPVETILLALDVTDDVIDEAINKGATLIVSHHPLIFDPIKSVTDCGAGAKVLRLAENGIAAISMHTNLDIARGGVNDVLIELLGAKAEGGLDAADCGRVGTLEKPLPLSVFLERCKVSLAANGLRYYDAGRAVYHLAVMGGSGGQSLRDAAEKGCDTYVTADVKYHQFLEAAECGINLIDADHFCTENPVIPVLAQKLRAHLPALTILISERHRQIVSFF